jgi:cytochrome P450
VEATTADTPFVYDEPQRSTEPYALWEQARVGCPVTRVEGTGAMNHRINYHVTRWNDVEAVLRDGDTFSASINNEQIGQYMGELILGMDGQEHRSYRNLVAPAFRASQLEKWDATLIRPTIDSLLDAIAPLGRADLVASVTSKYPARVICGIVGVPLDDADQFLHWADQITGGNDHDTKMAGSIAMQEFLAPIIEQRRADPGDDVISDLVQATVDGEKLTDAKIYGFLKLMLPAGAETTYRIMGTALSALLSERERYERVMADRALVAPLIEEALRWETSVTEVTRMTTRDTTIGGCPVPAGATLSIFTASANRDETRFDHADVFDLDRPPQNHVAFGTGEHQCLGMHLARLELRVGLHRILDRLPNLRLDPDAPAPVIGGFQFRGPGALHVLFDPS